MLFSGLKTTAAPPDIVIPNEDIPPDMGGGGIIIQQPIGGEGSGPPAVIGIGGPGGPISIAGVGLDVAAGPEALASGLMGPGPPATGARAGPVVGTVLGK